MKEKKKIEDLLIVSVDCRYARIRRGFNFITPSIQFHSFHFLRETEEKGRGYLTRNKNSVGSVGGAWKCSGQSKTGDDKDSPIATCVGFLLGHAR